MTLSSVWLFIAWKARLKRRHVAKLPCLLRSKNWPAHYTQTQEYDRQSIQGAQQGDSDTSTEELKKEYWQEQKKLYEQVSDDAGKIARANSLSDVQKETTDFWAWYWGSMSLLENYEVAHAMKAFGSALGD